MLRYIGPHGRERAFSVCGSVTCFREASLCHFGKNAATTSQELLHDEAVADDLTTNGTV
jgi:hypothetical protein